MRGLLIKDIRLIKGQAKLMMVGLVVILTAFSMWSPSYVAGYGAIIGGMVAVSTLSYDEYEKGLSFLFALPIRRKTYVREKYLLLLLLSAVYSFVPVGLMEILKPGDPQVWQGAWTDRIPGYLATWMILTLVSAVTIPLQLKFGAEKSRIVLYALLGISVAVCYMVTSTITSYQIYTFAEKFGSILAKLGSVGLLALGALLAAALYFLVMQISIRIMLKKEF